jgi:hypothetical protein
MGVKADGALSWQNYYLYVPIFSISGSLTSQKPLGLYETSTDIILLFYFNVIFFNLHLNF